MKFRLVAALYLVNFILLVGIATQEPTPGYMDADYYYASGLSIATTGNWNEPFIWNYLADPVELPHPAFTYWMPLAGIISAIGIKLSGLSNFWGARIGFILIAACSAPLTALLAKLFTPQKWASLLAGSLALFSGFYYAYLPTTETFSICMVLGSIFFLLVWKLQQAVVGFSRITVKDWLERNTFYRRLLSPAWVYSLLGFICGLMYLTRVDGLLWIGMGGTALFLQWYQIRQIEKFRSKPANIIYRILIPFALFSLPIILLTGPWFLRNVLQFGTLFAPGTGRALWLTSYDELFTYPTARLTFVSWINAGLSELLKARAWALGLNLLTAFAVQGGIILSPLTILGMWANRQDWRVILGVFGWLLTFFIMTFIFSFQGARGGFFHAGAGFQPLFWALVPSGLGWVTKWVGNRRNWEYQRAVRMFATGVVIVMVIMTLFVTRQRLNGSNQPASAWGFTESSYPEVESFLVTNGASESAIVMVNNPPGYYAMTGRRSIVIPHGDLKSTLLVGKDFQASYLILDENFPQGLEEIYTNPGDYPGLQYMDTVNQMQIFFIRQ